MKVSIPTDKDFRYEECRKLFLESNNTLGEEYDFDYIISTYHFFQFVISGKLVGCIYFYYKNNRLYIASFANRKFVMEKLEALKESLTFYSCDIYAETTQKHVAQVLLKVGFKKIGNNTYKYERE